MFFKRLLNPGFLARSSASPIPQFTKSSPNRSFTITAFRKNIDMETVNTGARLEELRKLMKSHKIDVYSMRGLIHVWDKK